MEVRTPAVSGTFYPDDEKELKSLIRDCFIHPIGPGKIPTTRPSKVPPNKNIRCVSSNN